jgi:Uma2 family endonuclease
MNVLSSLPMDRTAFLAWVEGREGRYELAQGRVVMMTGGSRGHGFITRRLSNALESRLDAERWAVWTSDFAVNIGPSTIRYPDVVVDAVGGQWKDLTATAPILVAEILSPSSVTTDLGDKAAEYLHLPSLLAYLVLSQDEPKAWIWVRGQSGFAGGSEVVAGEDGVVRIPARAIELPLADIYRGFAFPAEAEN